MAAKQNIALVGFMGVGKSTVCAALSRRTGARQLDTDAELVRREGLTVNEMFAQYGEPWFREKESALCAELSVPQGLIISCGGGLVMRPENAALLRRGGRIVLLTACPQTILARVGASDGRPLLRGHKNEADIAALMEQRRPAYEAAADLIVETDGKTVAAICAEILQRLGA